MNDAEIMAKIVFVFKQFFDEIKELKNRVATLEGESFEDLQQDDPKPKKPHPKEAPNSIEFDLDEAGIDLSLLRISGKFIKQNIKWLEPEVWNTINDVLKRHNYKWVSWEVRDAQGEPVLKKDGTPKKDGRWES